MVEVLFETTNYQFILRRHTGHSYTYDFAVKNKNTQQFSYPRPHEDIDHKIHCDFDLAFLELVKEKKYEMRW